MTTQTKEAEGRWREPMSLDRAKAILNEARFDYAIRFLVRPQNQLRTQAETRFDAAIEVIEAAAYAAGVRSARVERR